MNFPLFRETSYWIHYQDDVEKKNNILNFLEDPIIYSCIVCHIEIKSLIYAKSFFVLHNNITNLIIYI